MVVILEGRNSALGSCRKLDVDNKVYVDKAVHLLSGDHK